MKSIYDAVKFLASFVPAVRTADENGSAVDTKGFGTAVLTVSAGDIDLASGNETYGFNVEESADGSTGWAAISGATTTVTADNDVKLIRLEGLNTGSRKRYLRAVLDVGGTTPSIPCSAVFALARAYNEPVN
jgi:hypothetical protein